MGVKGKLVSQISIRSEGDAFEYFKYPSQLPTVCPEIAKSVDLHSGHWGTVGSVIIFTFLIDGKANVVKEIIEEIDEEKKSITFKVIEGELMGLYNSFKIIVDVVANKMVTWTFEYDRKNEDVPEPHAFMDNAKLLTKQIERHSSLVPN